MIGRVEEEEEGFDPTMSFFLPQPSSPLSLYGSGLGYEYGGFTMIRSPSPPPLSPPWNFSSDDHHSEIQHYCFGGGLHNSIPMYINDILINKIKRIQKVYKGYRTRRNLADSAVIIEECWWKLLDFASLKHSSVSFFNVEKPETAVSRWARARTRAAKVGKGFCQNEKARKFALQHWLESTDPRHRYGLNLHMYYDIWSESESSQPFFYWLDIGDGKEVNLEKCPRAILQHQWIKYLAPREREAYEVIVENGKLVYKESGMLLETTECSEWIFVLSKLRNLYVGQKKKGVFHHSSFLAGGATTAAGKLVAHDGFLEAIWPYSGHYLPTEENFREFISFLEENHVDLQKHVGHFQNTSQGQVSPQSATVTLSRTLLLEAPQQDVGSAIIEATSDLSPNKAPMSLVEVSSSIVEATHGTCEAKGLAVNTINQKKRTISSSKSALTGSLVSLEDLQQHFSMTREKAAESLRVSVPTLKRSCRKHGISRWPYLKKTKKNPSLSDLNSVNVTLRDSIAGEFDKKFATTNLSLCHVQPMVPLTSLSGTLSLETPNQDVGSVTVVATDNLPLNDLDSEEQKSMVGCDAINGDDGIGEAEGLTSSSKRAGTGTSISLEDLQQHCYMTRNEAAKKLGVSISTLKRACREHKISSWLHLKRREKYESLSELKSMDVTKQAIVTSRSRKTDFHAVNLVQEVQFVTVKAKYVDKMIKFELASLSKIEKLEEEVAKRLKLEVGSFSIEYLDEANDQILLACSEDLQYCIDTWTSLGKTEIRMLVKLTATS